MGEFLGLLVHDLRNPTATVCANADFLAEIPPDHPERQDAFEDLRIGVKELTHGLEVVSWIAQSMEGRLHSNRTVQNVSVLLSEAGLDHVCKDLAQASAQAGRELPNLLRIAKRAFQRHGFHPAVEVINRNAKVIVRVVDVSAEPMKDFESLLEWRSQASTKKERGPYARFAGWVAIRAIVESWGGTVEAVSECAGIDIILNAE